MPPTYPHREHSGFDYSHTHTHTSTLILNSCVVDHADGQRVNNLCSSPRCVALFDTGTSFIGIPNDLWLSVISFIIRERDDCVVNQEAGTVQCKIFQPETQTLDYSKLPIIAFGFNRIPFTLSPQQYIVGNTILLVRLPKEVPEFIMGDVFIDHYYTVFDGDSRYIGIAIGDNVSIWSWGVALLAALAVSGGIGIGFLLVQRRHARGIVGFGAARSHTAAADGPGSGIGGAGAGVGYRMSSSRGHRLGGNPSGLQPVPLDER